MKKYIELYQKKYASLISELETIYNTVIDKEYTLDTIEIYFTEALNKHIKNNQSELSIFKEPKVNVLMEDNLINITLVNNNSKNEDLDNNKFIIDFLSFYLVKTKKEDNFFYNFNIKKIYLTHFNNHTKISTFLHISDSMDFCIDDSENSTFFDFNILCNVDSNEKYGYHIVFNEYGAEESSFINIDYQKYKLFMQGIKFILNKEPNKFFNLLFFNISFNKEDINSFQLLYDITIDLESQKYLPKIFDN